MAIHIISACDLKVVFLHSMDHSGVVVGSVWAKDDAGCGHVLKMNSTYEDCGVVFEDVTCTCGIEQHVRYGSGCWQHGHNEPMPDKLELDELHELIYRCAQNQDNLYEWQKV